MTDPVVPKAESCTEDDLDGGMWSAAETLCKLLADNEKKIGQPHKAGLVTGKAGLWRGNAAMNHVDLIRVPIHGFTAMVNTHENDCYMDSGIGFHGAKALESVYGILNDGQIRPVSTTEGGIQYAASTGFYAQSFAPGHDNEETNLRHWKALNDAIGHRSDTGLIFEIHWRADKKVISRSCDEEKHCRDGVCTRLKSSEDRYMFHQNNAELAALWITTHWMNYADVTMCHLNKTHTNRCLGANVTSVCLHAAKARSVGGGASCGNSDYSGASGGWGDGAWSNYRHQTHRSVSLRATSSSGKARRADHGMHSLHSGLRRRGRLGMAAMMADGLLGAAARRAMGTPMPLVATASASRTCRRLATGLAGTVAGSTSAAEAETRASVQNARCPNGRRRQTRKLSSPMTPRTPVAAAMGSGMGSTTMRTPAAAAATAGVVGRGTTPTSPRRRSRIPWKSSEPSRRRSSL
jgi:hypothetical protein